jgi:hypothetical protein
MLFINYLPKPMYVNIPILILLLTVFYISLNTLTKIKELTVIIE